MSAQRSFLLLLLLGGASLSSAQSPVELPSLQLGQDDTLIVQQYSIGCFGDGLEWARITRVGDSLKIRYWSRDTTWVLQRADESALETVRNFCTGIAANDAGCASTTTDWYLISLNFKRLIFANGKWYLGEVVNIDDVKNSATLIRQSCGGNEYPWHQLTQELVRGPLVIGSKADRKQRKRFDER